jgi:hypothetical protein
MATTTSYRQTSAMRPHNPDNPWQMRTGRSTGHGMGHPNRPALNRLTAVKAGGAIDRGSGILSDFPPQGSTCIVLTLGACFNNFIPEWLNTFARSRLVARDRRSWRFCLVPHWSSCHGVCDFLCWRPRQAHLIVLASTWKPVKWF